MLNLQVRVAEWSKALDSSSSSRKGAWIQIPLQTKFRYSVKYANPIP